MEPYVVANRDPTEKDPPYGFLWWNSDKNKFFKYRKQNEKSHIWEKLEEKLEEKE